MSSEVSKGPRMALAAHSLYLSQSGDPLRWTKAIATATIPTTRACSSSGACLQVHDSYL
jgi:hypothetical protein